MDKELAASDKRQGNIRLSSPGEKYDRRLDSGTKRDRKDQQVP